MDQKSIGLYHFETRLRFLVTQSNYEKSLSFDLGSKRPQISSSFEIQGSILTHYHK